MSSVSNRRRRLGSAGVASLEFALIMVPFLWMVLAVFDLGRYLFTVQAMVTLVTDTQRYVMLNTEDGVPPGCVDFNAWSNTTSAGPPPVGLDASLGTICVTFVNQQTGWSAIQVLVSVQYPFVAITPGLSALTSLMTDQGDYRLIEQATYSY
jgi:hypothetical protein